MSKKVKTQRLHEFRISVRFDKPVSAAVARRELRASLVGFQDWCLDECAADQLTVKAISSMPAQPRADGE